MKILFNLVALLFIVALSPVAAQEQEFRGQMLERDSEEPLPFAHIDVLDAPGTGAITNRDGYFVLRVDKNIPTPLRVKISFIGYESDTVRLEAGQFRRLYLSRSVHNLATALVTSRDEAKLLLRKAIEKIPDNYSNQREKLVGKVTEWASSDSARQKPYYQSDALIEADKLSYQKRNDFGNVQTLEGTTRLFVPKDSLWFRVCANITAIFEMDFVARRKGPLNLSNLDETIVNILDTIPFEGQPLIRLYFNSDRYRGWLYIGQFDYAIQRIDINLTEKGLKNTDYTCGGPDLFFLDLADFLFNKITIEYRKFGDAYRLRFIRLREYYYVKSDIQDHLFLEGTFSIISIKEGEPPIPPNERLTSRDFLFDQIPYQLDSSVVSRYPESQQEKRGELRKVSSLEKSLNQFSLRFNWQVFSWQSNGFQTQFGEPFEWGKQTAAFDRLSSNLVLEFGFPVQPTISLVSQVNIPFVRKQINGTNLGVVWNQPWGITERFSSLLGLRVGIRNLGTRLGTYSFEEEFEWKNKKYDSGEVDVFALQRDYYLSPSLGFEYLFTPNWGITIRANYFLPFISDNSLNLREQDEFWFFNRQSSTWKNNTAFQTSSRADLLEVPYSIEVGLIGLPF